MSDICGMEHYRFRADFRVDVEVLMSLLADARYEITSLNPKYPDVQVDMFTKYPLSYVIMIMKTMPGSHTMYQTIAPAKKYSNTFEPNEGFSAN